MLEALVNRLMSDEWMTYHQSLRAQCTITARLLLLAAFVVVVVQLSNAAVDCVADKRDLPASLVDSLCYNQKLNVADRGDGADDDWDPRGYYTWVAVYLILLAMLTFLPLEYWTAWENNVENRVARMLNSLEDMADEQAIRRRADVVWQAMEVCEGSGYAQSVLLSRVLAYVAFDVAMRGTDHMLGGGFMFLGWNMLWQALGVAPGEVSPMDGIFPATGTCTIQLANDSSSNGLASTAVCKLNYSRMLSKVHVALWLWLTLVRYTITGCLIAASLAFHRLGRAALVRKLFGFGDERNVQLVAERLDLGALLFLRQLRLRVYPHIYTGVLELIAEDLLRHED